MTDLSTEAKLDLLRIMLTIRNFELTMTGIFKDNIKLGKAVGAFHSCEGQEAIAAGVCGCLRKDDYVFSTHRGHGHAIAKGIELEKLASELLGKEAGCSRGRGGSMHLFDLSIGLMGGNGIVGGNLPLVLGAGYSIQYNETDQVAVSFFGDGAVSQGSFHESLNMATLKNYPIIYVCENNQYAATTHFSKQCSVENVADKAEAYGIEGIVVDGNDVIAVYEAASNAIEKARNNCGPTLLECKTYRHNPHCMVIPEHRDLYEVQTWKDRDPIVLFRNYLIEGSVITSEQAEQLETAAKKDINQAVDIALDSPFPEPVSVMDGLWA